jgi:hypothetical protein
MTERIAYSKGYKNQLKETISLQTGIIPPCTIKTSGGFAQLNTDGLVIAFKGYAWDGATKAKDTPAMIRPSLWHDIFCQFIAEGVLDTSYRKQVDELLAELYQEDAEYLANKSNSKIVRFFKRGYSRIKKPTMYRLVRMFGGFGSGKKPILYAP